jgi:hypothetical protein
MLQDDIPYEVPLPTARHYGDSHIYTSDGTTYQWNHHRRIFERIAHLPDATARQPVVAPPPAHRWGFWKGFWFGALLAWITPSGGGHHHYGDDCGY